ncbi:MAG TPA: hypothetical protein VGC96_09200 [Candidatus Elarobacter sp.]
MATRISALVVLAVVLAGCGTSTSRKGSGLPPAPHVHRSYALHVWLLNPALARHRLPFFASAQRLAMATSGSSSCPNVPGAITVLTPHSISIDLSPGSRGSGAELLPHPPAGGVCTADFGATRMLVALPRGIDVHHAVTVTLSYPGHGRPFVETVPPL